MAKKRIHELAKELSVTSADLIQKITDWKLLPGVKLVASSGIEDYLADDISRRLGSPGDESSAAPQVVRRRKKSPDQAEAGLEATTPASVEDESEAQSEASAPEHPIEPTISAPPAKPKTESAIIIATPPTTKIKDAQKNVPATVIAKAPALPDFKKLVPGVVPSP